MKLFTRLSVVALGILAIPIFVFAETAKERQLCSTFRNLSALMSVDAYSTIPRANEIKTIVDTAVTTQCTTIVTNPATQSIACTNAKLLLNDLYKGVADDMQVKYLQIFLNNSGTPVDEPSSPTYPGSLGYETTHFGTLTELAVKKWQNINGGTSGLGRVDAVTRAKMVAVACATDGATPPTYSIPTVTVDNANPNQGDKITFTWTSGASTATCYWSNNGVVGGSLSVSPMQIDTTTLVAGTYAMTVSCFHPDNVTRTSQPLTVRVTRSGSTTPISCTGTHPQETPYLTLNPYTSVVAGPSTPNTSWKYGESSCGWTCVAPYVRDGNNGCKAPTTPTPQISCTGTHPQETPNLKLSYYSDIVAGPSTPNTSWKYGESSCGWVCVAPQVRDGNNGCKAPTPGTGVKVKVVDLTPTNPKTSGIKLSYGTVSVIGNPPHISQTTDANGEIPEFWYPELIGAAEWSVINMNETGYKIQKAFGCTPHVYVHAGKQYNQCRNAKNGSAVTIYIVKGDISTQPITWFSKSSYKQGENLSGGIIGGDPFNTYACMSSPNDGPINQCTTGSTAAYRKLGGAGDDWQIVSDGTGDRIVLTTFSTAGFPVGTYTGYARTGLHGVSTHTSFTLTK